MILPYRACFTRSSTATTTVLSILSLTTRPSRTLRLPRAGACCCCCSAIALLRRARCLVRDLFRLVGGRLLGRVRGLGLLHERDDAELAFTHHGVDARDLALNGAQSPVAFQLTRRRLEAEVEQLLL